MAGSGSGTWPPANSGCKSKTIRGWFSPSPTPRTVGRWFPPDGSRRPGFGRRAPATDPGVDRFDRPDLRGDGQPRRAGGPDSRVRPPGPSVGPGHRTGDRPHPRTHQRRHRTGRRRRVAHHVYRRVGRGRSRLARRTKPRSATVSARRLTARSRVIMSPSRRTPRPWRPRRSWSGVALYDVATPPTGACCRQSPGKVTRRPSSARTEGCSSRAGAAAGFIGGIPLPGTPCRRFPPTGSRFGTWPSPRTVDTLATVTGVLVGGSVDRSGELSLWDTAPGSCCRLRREVDVPPAPSRSRRTGGRSFMVSSAGSNGSTLHPGKSLPSLPGTGLVAISPDGETAALKQKSSAIDDNRWPCGT